METIPTLIIALSCALVCFYVVYSMSHWKYKDEDPPKKQRRKTIWFKDGHEI